MEKKNGGFKSFLITLAVILFSVVGFIIKIFINSTPIEDFPSFTPIIFVVIIVASVGYSLYAIFFGTDSFYRKKRLEKRAKRQEELKRTHEGKTLKEIYEKEDKKERVKINKKTNWTLVSLIIFILLCVLGGSFYWFEYRPTEIRKSCSYVKVIIPEVQEVTKSESERSKEENTSCKKEIVSSGNCTDIDSRHSDLFDVEAFKRWLDCEGCDSEHPFKEQTSYQPSREEYREASEEEYEKCLRSNGIVE